LYDGETLNNFIIDCLDIENLTDDEKDALKEAFENRFIVFAYQSNEACVAKIFADIFQHPLIFEEVESSDVPEGESHDVFAAELHGIHIWTHHIVFADLDDPQASGSESNPDHNTDGPFDDPLLGFEFPIDNTLPLAGTFEEHSLEILKWILTYNDRRDILEAQGDVIFSQNNADLNMVSKRTSAFIDPTIASRVSDPTGTLGDIAASYIHTSTYTAKPPGGEDPTYSGNYQMTTYVWSITANGPAGVFSYVFIAQDFNLQSSGLYRRTGDRDNGWYLRQFTNTNRLKNGSNYLTSNEAIILDNDPQSVSASVSTETQSTGFSVGGDISTDGPSVGGSASWENSVTIQKAEVAIDNLSISSSTANDASWRYSSNQPNHQDASIFCTWDHLSSPPALATSNFQPTQSFIFRIDPKFADNTLTLESRWQVSLERTTLNSCSKIISCYSCGSQSWKWPFKNKHSDYSYTGNSTIEIKFKRRA